MRRLLLGLLLAGIAGLIGSANASAANYSFYVGCEYPPEPSHACLAPDEVVGINAVAFFEADEDTNYELCIEYPNTSFICIGPFLAEADAPQYNGFAALEVGRYEAVWYFAGTDDEIGYWEFNMVEPPPPPPPVVPAVVAPVPPPTVDADCKAAQKRVSKAKGRLRKATDQPQKAKLQRKLKKARAAAKHACA
jgi:hypothetical protein